jgi:hypothetical protein
MNAMIRESVQLGELVAAVWDEAARHSDDPKEVSRMTTEAVTRMAWWARSRSAPREGDVGTDSSRRQPCGLQLL